VQEIGTTLKVSAGRALAQVVSHRFPTAAARVRAQVTSCGICGGQSDTGACFLRVLLFPLPVTPPIDPHSSPSIIIRGLYSRPFSGLSNSGLVSTPTQETEKSVSDAFLEETAQSC
jgi:hypothetical protein